MRSHRPLADYLHGLRTAVGQHAEVTPQAVVEYGLPLGAGVANNIADPITAAGEFLDQLREAGQQLRDPRLSLIVEYYMFSTGSVATRNRAAAAEARRVSLPAKFTEHTASSLLRAALEQAAEALMQSDWVETYVLGRESGRPSRVSYGFTHKRLHVTLAIDRDDPSLVTYERDMDLEINRDRVRLIPRHYEWAGFEHGGTEELPELADPAQHALTTEDGKSFAEGYDRYHVIYLGQPYAAGSPCSIKLRQRFIDPARATRPWVSYRIEPGGVPDLMLACIIPEVYAANGVGFETGDSDGAHTLRWRIGEDSPAPEITCEVADGIVKCSWQIINGALRNDYKIEWTKPSKGA